MQKLIRSFFEGKIPLNYNNEKFDYSFNSSSSSEEFDIEFDKFLSFYNSVFYFDNRLVTVLNSCDIRIKYDDLLQLLKLYNYSTIQEKTDQQYLLADFIFSYYKTIHSRIYGEKYPDYQDSRNDFKEVLKKAGIKNFFNTFLDIVYNFYKQIITHALDNDIFISEDILNKILSNLSSNDIFQTDITDMLIVNNRNLAVVIEYDNDIISHFDVYFNYIIDSISNENGYNHSKEILSRLNSLECLSDDNLKQIINIYVLRVNSLCERLKEKNYSFIQGIANIENLKSEVLFLLKNINVASLSKKNKIKQCLVRLLSLKRYLLSDDNYVNSELHETSFDLNIKRQDVNNFINSILDNEYSIYGASRMNFNKQMETALEIYSEHPMQSLISVYQIDSKSQTYYLTNDLKLIDDNFKNFYDQIGKNFTETHPKLLNKLQSNYYEELLKYLSKSFSMQQNLVISLLGKDNFKTVINRLKKIINYTGNNDYVIVVHNILAIEANILTIMDNHGIKHFDNGFQNINELVKVYKDDVNIINGLMYLNYILYEKSGLNLRNEAMHGSLINTTLDIPLLVSFSGLIFVSWLLNEKK